MIQANQEFRNLKHLLYVLNIDCEYKGGYQKQLRLNKAQKQLAELGLQAVRVDNSQKLVIKAID